MKRFKRAIAAGRRNSAPDAASRQAQEEAESRRTSLPPWSEDSYFLPKDDGSSQSPNSPSARADTGASSSQIQPPNFALGDRDPFGLTVLYTPEEAYKLDIIFVHGLGGTSRLTWSKGKDLKYFWPQNFFPAEPGICDARISTFGYDSSIFAGSARTTVSIMDFAKGLLFDLKYATTDKGEKMAIGAKPIIFVVHSMGGLIVKMAFMQGLYDPEYKPIVSSITSIIFLATPHRGSDFAETLNRVLKATMIKAPKQFIQDLGKNSPTLLKLNEEFRHFAPTIGLASFYETRTTSLGTDKYQIVIVNQDSATLGYPGETSASMDANHHTVCKYESRRDPNYLKVRNYIQSRISDIVKSQNSRNSLSISMEDASEDKKLQAMFDLSGLQDSDYIFFKDRCLRGTCTWIIKDAAFIDWLHDLTHGPRVLWLRGKPGTGKSTTSSYIISHLSRQKFDCQYFFVRFSDTKKRSLSSLLRSLAFQIAQSSSMYRKRLLRLSEEASQLRKADAHTIWQRLFRDILFKVEFTRPLYWLIDGLDECDTPRRLIKMIGELSTAKISIRVLLVSRSQRDLAAELHRLDRAVRLDVISSDGQVEDFERYVALELDVPGSTLYRQTIAQKIVERALGNFLWVHLAVKKINACQTAEKREQALEQLPPGMDKFFDRMGQSIADIEEEDDKQLASNILGWTTCSLRNLTLNELLQALNMSASAMPDLQRMIEDLCAGFVVVDSAENVSLIHKTAKEYLISESQSRPFAVNREQVNEMIFRRCLRCITTIGLRTKIKTDNAPKFLDYAATSWFAHLDDSSHQSEALLTTLINFVKTAAILVWIQALATTGKVRELIRASTHLNNYATRLKESEWDAMPRDRQITERELIEEWATDLVKIAGKFGSRLAHSPESIYKLIPPFCPPDSVIYRTFGAKEQRSLAVSGPSGTSWDDSLARLQFGANVTVSLVLTVGHFIAILVPAGTVLLFHSTTFEKVGQLNHGERISRFQRSASGTTIVTYGFATTKVWDVLSRQQTLSVPNPSSRPQALCLTFTDDDENLLLGGDDRVIRELSLHDDDPSWDVVSELGLEPIEGAIVNSPSAMAISSDGKFVVLGYRAHPVSVWSIDGDHIGVNFRNGSANLDGRTMSTECLEVMWHPHSSTCQVFGLYEDGIVFRWSPNDDEYSEIPVNAGSLAISHDGNFLATGDRGGRVKIYNTLELELVYQLRSKDCVFDLTFSPDASRFYDIRGQYANVWEPSALMRLSEQTDRGSDSTSETDSTTTPKSTVAEVLANKLDPITAMSSQPGGRLYCSGTEDGVVELFDVTKGKVCAVAKSVAYFTTEKITWSPDGCRVACGWSNSVMLKAVIKDVDTGSLKVEGVIPGSVKLSGAVQDLLFDAGSDNLLVQTMAGVDIISLKERKIVISRKQTGPKSKWINHPTNPEFLLAVGHDKIQVLDWSSLSDRHTFTFSVPEKNTLSEPVAIEDTASLSSGPQEKLPARRHAKPRVWKPESKESVERALVTLDQCHILVQVSVPVDEGQSRSHLFLIDVARLQIEGVNDSIPGGTSSTFPSVDQSFSTTTLEPIWIPAEIASRIHIPLSFVSASSRRERDKLIFLDHDDWLCSWRLSLPSDVARRPSAVDSTKVVQHYFLPGDWISPDCIALATVMADGTLLIPRNGEVAVVKSDSVGA